MKKFLHHSFSVRDCAIELKKFEGMLASKAELKERDEILPFFRENKNLSAFLGMYIPDISNPDLIAVEYDLFGDFSCDLVVGDSRSKAFLFIEFEDAKRDSLFVKKGEKSTPEWAPRLEHGFSQVVDWFWKLNDMEKTDDYENRFGARHVAIHGLVVVGREQVLESREKVRLKWRQDHTIVHSKKVSVITFDQLASDAKYRLSRYPDAAKAKDWDALDLKR